MIKRFRHLHISSQSSFRWLLLLFLSLCMGMGWSSCDDDEWSTSPSDQPTFSVDTLHMGTILTGNSSKTYQLKIYNRCQSELRLSSIVLRDASTSGFRMNVDGMNGTSFIQSNLLRIASGDSIFIFVEASFLEGGHGVMRHTDYIDVMCNGRLKTIVLDAQSKDVLKYHGKVLAKDEVWVAGTEVQIFDSLVIPQGVKLTLLDSVTLYLHDKTDIRVRGTLDCQGTLGRPVVIRGDRTDKMFENLFYDNLPSQWGSMYIDNTAQDCRFVYTDIHGMTDGIWIDSTEVLFDCCHIKNSDGNLLSCQMSRVTMQNCLLSNAAGAIVQCQGGWYDIVHCTLANYNFSALAKLPALRLSNYVAESETGKAYSKPLHQCNLLNTLIYGRWQEVDVSLEYYRFKDETAGNGQTVYADSIFAYRFDHCLIKGRGTDDKDFIQTVWDKDPVYQVLDHKNYTYDFHLQSSSPAVGRGSSEGTQRCPLDLDGVSRMGQPSIGCYEVNTNATKNK